jgi:hypothetical protein
MVDLTPEQQAARDAMMARRDANAVVFARLTAITLSPIALGIGFLCVHAIAVRSRPHANTTSASLGGWTRIVIVLMFVWSALVTGLVVIIKAEMTTESALPLVSVTYGPIVALWLLYFAVRWVHAGFRG